MKTTDLTQVIEIPPSAQVVIWNKRKHSYLTGIQALSALWFWIECVEGLVCYLISFLILSYKNQKNVSPKPL